MRPPTSPPIPERVRAALAEFANLTRSRFEARLAELRLFGSYARGDEGAESDVDVLVTVDGLTDPERRAIFSDAYDVFARHEVTVAPLALSAEQFSLLRERQRLIAREIERDGVAL